jgi:hypothetical protein
LSEVEVFVRPFAEDVPFFVRAWHAHILASMGRLDEASPVWASVLPHMDDFPRYSPEWIINLTASADMCLLLDQRELAPACTRTCGRLPTVRPPGGSHAIAWAGRALPGQARRTRWHRVLVHRPSATGLSGRTTRRLGPRGCGRRTGPRMAGTPCTPSSADGRWTSACARSRTANFTT